MHRVKSKLCYCSNNQNQYFPVTQLHKSAVEAWEHIRELDEGENWAERNRVVSKSDHLLYSKCAQVKELGGGGGGGGYWLASFSANY